ncbi:SapC family protein [Pelomonas sp. SE-A7]|uniref:SapC family protein n=1 Tax=Pelomonas sp. SE-A7 TaxID=3054953 RepID=UPI00259C9DCE|nr:SapC family protein [Pelomonas sp. SE-A7]MDM4767338.1 SapC family protein [Pelomonas sp. SE-A7]
MSNPPLYGKLVPLDREVHKKLRLNVDANTVKRVQTMNSLFVAAAEFAEACKEFPIVFVRVGEVPSDGSRQAVAPLAVMGLKSGSNRFVDKDGKWTANYAPAYLRRYPFSMVRVEAGSDQLAMCFDADWEGFSETEGTSLFAEDGQPTEFLVNAKNFVESFERETERTRLACDELVKLDLLQDMRFEATLPNGEKLDVEGFMAIDEEKLGKLDDAKVVEIHRNGLLSLIEMHRVSMGNMPRLAGLEGVAAQA